MDGMVFDHDSGDDDEIGHLHTGTFTSGDRAASEDEPHDEDKGKGKQSGGIFGDGGGVFFDEADGFDPTDLQGLPYYDFVSARRKGLPLRRRMNDQAEQYLRTFIDDADLRDHVYEVASSSEHGYPTLLMDTGHIVQFHLYANDLQRVRVSRDIDPEIGVRMAMKAFAAAGKSLDPKDVKFGTSPEFEARMKPIWVAEYKRIQGGAGRKPHIDIPRSSSRSASDSVVRRAPKVGS